MIVDDLVTVSKSRFIYDEPEKLKPYFEKALNENRFVYLKNNNEVVGYLVYFLFDKQGIGEYLKAKNPFDFPEHKPDGNYLYIDENVVFEGKKANYLYLRDYFKKLYPNIKKVYWHNIHKKKNGKKKLIQYNILEET